ncbi:MAG: NAD(+)/NADH kinase [Lachnospiraceae bacterium]|nr:NAD(+)/NADH kinase [Lachnospiraceae bacterium]
MKTFHILTNENKDQGGAVSKKISAYLQGKGCTCTCEVLSDNPSREDFVLPQGTECVIVTGGDGTMIRAAGLIAGSVPMIGVNLGTLGFLEEIEVAHLEKMLDRLIAGDFEIENRMMLSGTCRNEPELDALNDIVITRTGSLKILHFEIFVNEMLLGTYTADGMIVSTPTGSTAYNLSAGGPIVEPDAMAILLTPICPHNLNTRAIVLSADDVIRIRISERNPGDGRHAAASFDGGRELELYPDESITIRRAGIDTKLIRLNKESFLNLLARKMFSPEGKDET